MFAGRAGEEFDAIALLFEAERTQAVSDFGGIEEGAEIGGESLSRRKIGWRPERARSTSVRRSSRAS